MRYIHFALAVVLALDCIPAYAQTDTITWTNTGGSYCLNVLTEDNQQVASGSYYCPYQSTSFAQPDGGASLYLQDLILEGISVVRGNNVPTSYNTDGSLATFSRTDTITANGWTGQATQNYAVSTHRRCIKYGCHTYTVNTDVGGSGMIHR
jgi:hypothetical protein